jgi:hypothetical protein
MRWAVHMMRMGGMLHKYKVLVGKSHVKRLPGNVRSKMDVGDNLIVNTVMKPVSISAK